MKLLKLDAVTGRSGGKTLYASPEHKLGLGFRFASWDEDLVAALGDVTPELEWEMHA